MRSSYQTKAVKPKPLDRELIAAMQRDAREWQKRKRDDDSNWRDFPPTDSKIECPKK